jgi:hypothetical protein
VVALIVDPGVSGKEQTFTGTVDTSGVQITGVVWTRGTNTTHAAGATVVDYVSATHLAMISKGALVAHNQDGTPKSGATYPSPILTTPTIASFTNATHDHSTAAKGGQLGATAIATGTQLVDKLKNPYKFYAYMTSAWSLSASGTPAKVSLDGEIFDTGSNFDSTTNHRFNVPVDGFYWLNGQMGLTVDAGNFIQAILYKNGSQILKGPETVTGSSTFAEVFGVTGMLQLSAGDYIELWGSQGGTQHAGTGSTDSKVTFLQGFLISAT